ncbi:G2/M phase-specific E3 ubiquitin-protein ligase-like [Rhizophagus clarus]|uniref:G2/M phase-specific E3 ubiquitin-protein ligase-like n=1 Tax=Rhizophagus clarus TaxID=94130 RepID=A0A8H3R0U6_9GLOM|nr:G2/M phase-specific E3 ubiquitin-protein ligase-like [Rhizophagus clarus]
MLFGNADTSHENFFTPALDNEVVCLICGHYEAQHEQFIELQLQSLRSIETNTSTRNEIRNLTTSDHSREDENDVTNFLNEFNIRNRLIMTTNQENNIDQDTEANVIPTVSFHTPAEEITTTSSFKCTMTIIMMPYINNNKIVKLHSFQWSDLQFHELIKQITFKDDSFTEINRMLVKEFPKIKECGWRILRPIDTHSNNLIPFIFDGPITGQIMKLACTARKRCYIGPTKKNIFDRILATNNDELIRFTTANQESLVSQSTSKSTTIPQTTRSTNFTVISQARPITSSNSLNSITTSQVMSTTRPVTIPSRSNISQIRPTLISQTAESRRRSSTISQTIGSAIRPIGVFPSSSTMNSITNFTQRERTQDRSHNWEDNSIDSRSTNQFREDLLISLRNKYHIDELDTFTFHIKAEYCLDYFMNWGLTARIEDILKKPIIVMEDAVDTGGVFRDMTTILWQKIRFYSEFNGGKLFENDVIQQNSELVSWEYATSIGKLLFWTFIHCGSWPKWLKEFHMQFIIGGSEYASFKEALYDYNIYLYNLSERIKNDGWQMHESDIRFWMNENDLNDQILQYDKIKLSEYIAEYEILVKRQKSLEMVKEGFNIGWAINEIKKFNWFKIECELYSPLTSDEFFNQLDQPHIRMVICEVPNKKNVRERIYGWFREWIITIDNETIEQLLKFITGSTRIPLPKKISIQWRHTSGSSAISNVYCKLPFSRTCSYTLILCQDYENFDEFIESFKICLSNCEGFSELSYGRIKNLIDNPFLTETTVTERELNIINEEQRENQEINEQNNANIEIVDLTNDNQIIIDIHRETVQKKKRRKQKRQVNNNRSQPSQECFINMTAEDIENASNRKNPSGARSRIITRSMTRDETA